MMVDRTVEPPDDLLEAAEATYAGVLSDPLRYAERAAEILDRARARRDPEALVAALRARAWALHAVMDNRSAKRLLDEAVLVAESNGLDRWLGDALVARAATLHELGRRSATRADLARAGTLVGDKGRPDVTLQLATLEYNAGRLSAASDLYRQVMAEPGCSAMTWVKAANNRSNAQIHLGSPRVGLDDLERAAHLAAGLGPLLLAVVTNTKAMASFHCGLVVESLRLFEQAGPLYLAAGVPPGEHYLDYSDALVDLMLLDEASNVAYAAAGQFEQHGARLMAAEARLRCARLALAAGDSTTAGTLAEATAREFRRQGRTAWVARATVAAVEAELMDDPQSPRAVRRLSHAAATLQRMGLRATAVEAHLAAGRAALARSQSRTALHQLAEASRLARRQALLVRLRGRVAQALAAGAEGRGSHALQHCRAGMADLARHRAALPSVELRVLASGHGAELGRLALRAVLPTGQAHRALAWMERTRAASLLVVEPPLAEMEEEIAALRAVEHQLRSARRESGTEPPDLRARRVSLEHEIRRRSWTRGAGASAIQGRVPVPELQTLLDGAWLAEYAVIDGSVAAVVVEPQRLRLLDLGSMDAVSREVDAWLFAIRRLLRGGRFRAEARQSADHALGALARLLVEPLGVAADIPLVVVPAGALHRVPWSPLHSAAVSVAPSAAFWAGSRRRARRPAAPGVAVVAGPDLPGAVQEANQVHRRHPDAALLLPPDSTVDAAVSLLEGADLAHIACHGRLRADNPLFSALLLSDGPLTLHELVARSVAPRRVVLAACDTGVERSYAGDEVLGFVSALMGRGSAGVVASVIPVPDGACVGLMSSLHAGLRNGGPNGRVGGRPLAEALHQARAAADLDRVEDYVSWSGFLAFGAA